MTSVIRNQALSQRVGSVVGRVAELGEELDGRNMGRVGAVDVNVADGFEGGAKPL